MKIIKEAQNYAITEEKHELLVRTTQELDHLGNLLPVRLAVPRKWRSIICEYFHDSMWTGAHMGRDKTLEKISRYYYFLNKVVM